MMLHCNVKMNSVDKDSSDWSALSLYDNKDLTYLAAVAYLIIHNHAVSKPDQTSISTSHTKHFKSPLSES